MKNYLRLLLLASAWLPTCMNAQEVDRTKYPDYSDRLNPDQSLMTPIRRAGQRVSSVRPTHVNNANTLHFPPVFNQDGGSCGSASRICYMFTHEINSYRNADGKDPNHYYPSHFVWLLTNGNSGKDQFVQHIGVPSAATYGGQTYSKLFGNQNETDNDFGWMQGYEKWYSAMFNRMLRPSNFPVSVQTEEGREAVKNWLWNHNGDTEFHSGGIVGIGVASGGDWQDIPQTATNDEIGVTGMKYVNKWGTQVDHALTIVGYDDRIEFDLDGDGVYGEKAADEVGAWIIVNSWGSGWCNGGFIYCPYAHAVPAFNSDGSVPTNFWMPEIYRVRKDYRPMRTIKLLMDYSHRSELYLSAGVSSDLNAEEPEISTSFEHFKYAGDGANGDTNPAPQVPMLGRWADGKLHTEAMEFGYDLTDLSSSYDQNMPLKYFFMIDTKSSAIGSGKIYEASIMDYMKDEYGVETPFEATQIGDIEIKNAGNRTIISMVVQGCGIYAPQNANITIQNSSAVLSWDAPIKSALTLTGYNVYSGDELLASLPATTTDYTLPSTDRKSYRLTALYDGQESSAVNCDVPADAENHYVNVKKNGFTIPTVFGTKYEKATIEFWVRANTLANWNQSAGPGWGTFMFHGNASGALTVGWDTSNRMDVNSAFGYNWKHIAMVIDGSTITAYINGVKKNSFTSSKYSGIGGFGDLVFSNSTSNNSYTDARFDEFRIWKTARTAAEIKANYNKELGDASLSEDLLVYYKGDLLEKDGAKVIRDHTANGRHATFFTTNYTEESNGPSVTASTDLSVSLPELTENVYVGIPTTLKATAGAAAQTLTWTVPDAGLQNVTVVSPTVTFKTAGQQDVTVTATDKGGKTATATIKVNVLAAPAPNAEFTATKQNVAAGERISFHASAPQTGYSYEWSMPGADVEKAFTATTGATYQRKGSYIVKLTVTNPAGKSATSQKTITVSEVAPLAAFDVSPAVVVKGEATTLRDASKYGPNSWNWQLISSAGAMVGEGEKLTFRPEKPGQYDVKLIVENEAGSSTATQEGALIVCNADSKNGLNFTYDDATVTMAKVPFVNNQMQMTIDWWMRPNRLADMGNAIGDKASTILMTTASNGEMTVNLNGKSLKSGTDYVIAGSWHHYAVTLKSNRLYFYRDGKLFSSQQGAGTKCPVPETFAIGNANIPFSGQIDEFRVWNKGLTLAQIQKYANQPLEGTDLETAKGIATGLQLYYQFNQSSGDVTDMTGNGFTGIRSGFGPEGDAWGLSRGVFSLSLDAAGATDVTSRYLTNYKEPFANTGQAYNSSVSNRFMTLKDWKRENESNENNPTGAHVDTQKGNDLTFTTTWDGFDDRLTDHKCFQTVTLPAGAYLLTANYGNYEGQSGDSYLVAASGTTLPTTENLAQAIASTSIEPKGTAMSNSVFFIVPKEMEVSLGLLVNLGNQQCLTFASFSLQEYALQTITHDPTSITDITTIPTKDQRIYDLSGRRVFQPQKGQVYIIGNQKVMIK